MTRSTWLSLAVAAGLLVAMPAVSTAAAGCCQLSNSCERTDDADACTDAGGTHYETGFCDGKTCQPSVSGVPIHGVPVGHQAAVWLALPAAATGQPQASSAGFDCVTKSGDFCWGELGKGNQCVSSTTCTPTQLAECLPGFPMCPKVEPAPGPTPYPEY